MTTYVTEHQHPDRLRYWLWGDTPDDAFLMAASIGHDPLASVTYPVSDWTVYFITLDEWAAAVELGAQVTDRFGPAEWLNRDDPVFLARLREARAWGLTGASPLGDS